jgi:acyl dehydratase
MIDGCSYVQRHWQDVTDGEVLPRQSDPLSFTRAAAAPAATLDFYPLHHDPTFAQSQGLPTIIMSTLQIMGFVDRLATGWGGPATSVVRRQVTLLQPYSPGDTVVMDGRVVAKRVDEAAGGVRHLVDLEITLRNQRDEVCCPARLTVELPPRHDHLRQA